MRGWGKRWWGGGGVSRVGGGVCGEIFWVGGKKLLGGGWVSGVGGGVRGGGGWGIGPPLSGPVCNALFTRHGSLLSYVLLCHL